MARLKGLEGMEAKSNLDLHNKHLANENRDLKTQKEN